MRWTALLCLLSWVDAQAQNAAAPLRLSLHQSANMKEYNKRAALKLVPTAVTPGPGDEPLTGLGSFQETAEAEGDAVHLKQANEDASDLATLMMEGKREREEFYNRPLTQTELQQLEDVIHKRYPGVR